MKGASDVATRLMWNCKFSSGKNCSQTLAFARILHLYAIAVHRQIQFGTIREDLDSFASLAILRKNRNHAWPFRKSIIRICQWLEKEIQNEQNCENLPTVPSHQLVKTPPRRTGVSNPRRAFVETRNALSTLGTPSKGRPVFPKSRKEKTVDHQKRLDECPGCLYEIAKKEGQKDVRKDCVVCGAKTKYLCMICRLPYCFTSRDERIKKAIEKKEKGVEFLDGCRPASRVKMVTAAGSEWLFENSCFHIRHQKMLDDVAKKYGAGIKRAPGV